MIWDGVQAIADWSNTNQGVLTLILFAATLLLGWVSWIFAAIRRKPKLDIKLLPGPTFVCTFGTGQKHGEYDVHRTGIALYLNITNAGSAPTNIDSVSVGYHWAIKPFGWLWWRYRLGWYWIKYSTVSLDDFQVAIGDKIKRYPFLIQRSPLSGIESELYLQMGQSSKGVVYFEQEDSYGACFPISVNNFVQLKVLITDSLGRAYLRKFSVPKVSLVEAQAYNPSFGLTLVTLRSESKPISLPADKNGNLIPP